jgi:hypothetical protein
MQNDLQDTLNCAFAEVGSQVGELIRCMIEQEIDSHFRRITQLNSILSSDTCETTTQLTQASA